MELSKPFIIEGQVVVGRGRGAKLGFPTANILTDDKFLPLDWGVYFCFAIYNKKQLPAIAHIGPAKTFNEKRIRCEVHILDFDKNLMGGWLKIELLKKLRDTIKFASVQNLKQAIINDINQAKIFFNL